jgi:mRNA interferase MazF
MPSKKTTKQPSVPRVPQAGDQWEVVIVPFPFSTQLGAKRRPALVLSKRTFNQHGSTVLAMITTSGHHPWPGDVQLTDLKTAGLNAPCLVRLKLFTLDNRLIVKKIGRLAAADEQKVRGQLQTYMPW